MNKSLVQSHLDLLMLRLNLIHLTSLLTFSLASCTREAIADHFEYHARKVEVKDYASLCCREHDFQLN